VLARLIVCATLALVALPTAALADDGEAPVIPVPAADSLMATAHSLAVARWATDPCGGQVTMSWTHMGEGINARSQWMSIDVNDASTYSECSITYNLDVDWDWPKLCTVVEHELGHVSGHDHVNDPHDVMSPYYVYPAAECALPKSQAAAAPDRAPRSVASSKRASSAKKKASRKRAAKKRRASAAVKHKSSKKRDAPKRKKNKAHASLDAPFFDWSRPLLPA
jgi:matrixin